MVTTEKQVSSDWQMVTCLVVILIAVLVVLGIQSYRLDVARVKLEETRRIEVAGDVQVVPEVVPEPRAFIQQQVEWKGFCPGELTIRDPGASVSRRCSIIEYPNGTRESVNCVYYDDLMVHYRCVNATMVSR